MKVISCGLVLLFSFVFFTNCARFRINRSCKAPRTGACTDVWKCPFYVNLLKRTPRPFFVVKSMQDNLCGFVNEATPKVCCHPLENQTESFQHANLQLLPQECGPVASTRRITEGVNAGIGEFPWMALIAYKTGEFPEDEDFKCAGTLISEQFVLTAAHCVDEAQILGIRLGEYDLVTEVDCDKKNKCEAPVQDILISKAIVHPEYDPVSFVNDIALIKLATRANTSASNVKPICLPLAQNDLDGQFLTVTGWGVTETGHKSKVLKKISVPLVKMEECLGIYKSFKPLTRNQLCAGGYMGRDSCAGDSGGPLQNVEVWNRGARYVQYGIVSYGPSQCGIDGRPAIYTRVGGYLKWILDNLTL